MAVATLSVHGGDPDRTPDEAIPGVPSPGEPAADDDRTRRPRRISWLAVSSLAFGSIAALSAVRFFPGAMLTAVIGGWLGERALERIAEDDEMSGRGVAWWGVLSSALAFAVALFVAIQAQAVLTDPELLRGALERLEATPTP